MRGCARAAGRRASRTCVSRGQAKILYAEAGENNLVDKVLNTRLKRWSTCSLCSRDRRGVVRVRWVGVLEGKYLGRPEEDKGRRMAMTLLGNGKLQGTTRNRCP